MQDATKVQERIQEQVQHQDSKAEFLQEQLTNVLRNRELAEQELVKFKILKEGFNIAKGVLTQQLGQVRTQPTPNPLTIIGFEGALGRLTDLMSQTDVAIAKNEGSLSAFQVMEQQYVQQVQAAVSRGRSIDAQGAKAVEMSSRAETIEMIETSSGDAPITSVEDLISSTDGKANKSATKPMEATKKKTPSKRGRGRQKAK